VHPKWPELSQHVKLHVVTGKGGTGKSTVSAAVALALASTGQQVLLCEVEGRQGIAQLFDVAPLPYAESLIATSSMQHRGDGTPSGSLYALHIDPESALMEYLAMYYRLGRAGRALDRFGVIDFATTIAPGLRDVLLTGKVYEATKPQRKGKTSRSYDAIVLDAPPTGRITQFLNTNAELAGLAKVGPIKSQADAVAALLRSPQTAIHLVTILEEMPVQETADAITELSAHGLPVGAVLVNMTRPRDLSLGDPPITVAARAGRQHVARDLKTAGLPTTDALVDELISLAHDHAERQALEDAQRELVSALGVSSYELPRLPTGVDLGGLYELAEILTNSTEPMIT
jgi:anion-transporting  ArsA/GET3 family ATPase